MGTSGLIAEKVPVHEKTDFNSDLLLANRLLEKRGIPLLDAVRIVLDLVDACGGNTDIQRLKKCIDLGSKELEGEERTVTFRKALMGALASKLYRRPRTLSDVKQLMVRLMKSNPGLPARSLRSLTPLDCSRYLNKAFSTSRQLYKARLILSGVFTIGKKKGWCDENPISQVDVPVLCETEILALPLVAVRSLLHASRTEVNGECLTAVALMLFAGIRPREVQRLQWKDICFHEKVISLRPFHTKTGGARHVTIFPVLERWLKYYCKLNHPEEDQYICPRNWMKKWAYLRQTAGWGEDGPYGEWIQDCLRHTFASYHAKHFQDYASLQMEMGHQSSTLLRTRYLNMKGITRQNAKEFWQLPVL